MTVSNNTRTVRFTFNFQNKTIVGTKASFDKAGKGFGPVYDELEAMMKKQPKFSFEVKEPKKPAKPKQTYVGMNIKFMLDYTSAVNDAAFRSDMERTLAYIEKEKLPVYPLIKRMFLEHYAPSANQRFAYVQAKEIVSEYRHKGIIAAATTHTVPATDTDEAENLTDAA